MFLKSSLIIFLLNLSLNTFALGPNLPELLTKQSVQNIRFFSDDGTVTYFQKISGSFHLTHHYQTFDLLKSTAQTQFAVIISPTKKKILVETDEAYLNDLQFLRERTIYEADYLGKSLTKIGEGLDSRLHMNDTWMTFFSSKKRELNFYKFGSNKAPVIIKLKHKVNPYFIPQIVMLNDSTAAVTEMAPEGHQILYRFDLLTGSFLQAYKTPSPGMKLELCYNGQNLFVGQFPMGDTATGSAIFSVDVDTGVTLKKMDLIYSSTKNDLGNMICDASSDEIFFIQAQVKENEINIKGTELALLKVNSKEVSVLSQFGDVTQAFRMDHRVLIPYRGKFYVARGESNVKSDELKKDDKVVPKKQEEAVEETIEVKE